MSKNNVNGPEGLLGTLSMAVRDIPMDDSRSAPIANELRVLMIVANACTNDARVIKEAESIVGGGIRVRVLCKQEAGIEEFEVRNGVEYQRVPMVPPQNDRYVRLVRMIRGRGSPKNSLQELIEAKPHSSQNRAAFVDPRSAGPSAAMFQDPNFKIIKQLVKRIVSWCRLAYKWLFIIGGHALELRAAAPEIVKYRPHVIHVHDLMPLPLAVRVAPRIGAKVLYDSHELERYRNGLDGIGRMVTAFVEWRSIKKAHRVITVCDSIAEHLAATYGIQKPLVVLNAPDLKVEQSLRVTIRDRLEIHRSVPLAVYVGKVTIGRGLEQLVEALRYAEEFHVALLGPRVDSVAGNLISLAARFDVGKRFHMVDSVAPDEVVPFLATADVGVIPIQDVCLSYRYCLPNKLFELTFAAIPVCVSNLPEMRAVVEYGNTGIVMDERDPKDIARAMREAYLRREELKATGERLEKLKARYSWDVQARKLRGLYDELAAVCG